MFDLSWFEQTTSCFQCMIFRYREDPCSSCSGVGSFHQFATEGAVRRRMHFRDEIRLQMLWPFLDFSKNRRQQTRFYNWSWWIMTNIMTYHDIYYAWKYQYMSKHMKEKSLNLQTFELLVSSLHLHPSLFLLLPWVQERVLCVTQSHAAAINLHKRLEVDFHR